MTCCIVRSSSQIATSSRRNKGQSAERSDEGNCVQDALSCYAKPNEVCASHSIRDILGNERLTSPVNLQLGLFLKLVRLRDPLQCDDWFMSTSGEPANGNIQQDQCSGRDGDTINESCSHRRQAANEHERALPSR